MKDWTMDDVVMLIEIRGVYDGWSAAILADGRIVNRWNKDDHPQTYAATEAYIEENREYILGAWR